jgi:4,5-dihydroxyphthalate decarboxylase
MLIDGELDVVLGEKVDHPDLKPLFSDADAKAWSAKHGISPINHMVVVAKSLSDAHPDTVREVHRLLAESAKAAPTAPRFTADEMRRSLDLITQYAAQQGLIRRAYVVDELFDDVTRALI